MLLDIRWLRHLFARQICCTSQLLFLCHAEWHTISLCTEMLTWPVFICLPQPQLRDTTQNRGHRDTGWSLRNQKSNAALFQIVSELQNPQLVFCYFYLCRTTLLFTPLHVQHRIWTPTYFFLGLSLLDAPSFTPQSSLQPYQTACLCSQLHHHCGSLIFFCL